MATAAVLRQRAGWPIANRPQLTKLPHNSTIGLAFQYGGFQPLWQAVAPASTSMSHTLLLPSVRWALTLPVVYWEI